MMTRETSALETPVPQTLETPTLAAWTPELLRWLDRASRDAGFHLSDVAAVPDPTAPAASADAQRFAAWVDAGRAGEMDYLTRRDESGALVRGSLRVAMPWARSVVVCALNYNAAAPLSIDPAPPATGWIARYAWSGRTQRDPPAEDGALAPTDYHTELLARLRAIEAGLLSRAPCTSRCYVDTGPILERSFAAHAGIGWIGKNTCVINQQLGSWLLLGVIVTSLPVSEIPTAPATPTHASLATLPAPDRCGACTRCIDACPTGALLGAASPDAPREMDAFRCIAYLTIEKKGVIDESLRAPIGRQVFGCDICQDVCPWNRKAQSAPIAAQQVIPPRPELINPSLDWLASMDAREFKRRFKGSPLERTGLRRLLRNVAIAMGNSREPCFLPQLDAWAEHSEDPILREAAAWARAQIATPSPPDRSRH
jgi:epoxyqueuosine reductase